MAQTATTGTTRLPRLDAIDERLRKLRPAVIHGLTLALLALVGGLDYWTGSEFSFSVFYLAPIAMAAWYGGPRSAAFAPALAAATWFVSDASAGHSYSHPAIPWWNAAVRLGFFVLVASLLVRLRSLLRDARRAADHDVLTGALNSRSWHVRLAEETARCRRQAAPLTVGYIDLDHFKTVNDRSGHAAGDALLRLVVATLQATVRPGDVVARVGGDEFAFFLAGASPGEAAVVAGRLRDAVREAMTSRGWPVTASIGAATYVTVPADVVTMVRAADALMYAAKAGGRDGVRHDIIGDTADSDLDRDEAT